jgi:hypothetical protein
MLLKNIRLHQILILNGLSHEMDLAFDGMYD